ncbi:50S ribosomal protein L25 [Candidatus Kaiserbacteria bacterium]|nr:50S ribosomal protein L25 [Candidatus Kaiserbacteria bacterium]
MAATLEVSQREERGKATEALRANGKIPAVLYGPTEEAVAISLDRASFERTLREEGESSIYTLTGLGTDKEVLVHDVAFDPARGGVIHVDFYAIEAGKELTTDVPLEFIGDAPALKLGGTLTKVLHEVEVTCRPSDLPKHIEVDISALQNLDDQIHVSDLALPAGVKVENDPHDVIVLVQAVEEEKEDASAPVDMSAIEVEEKGKKEEEGEPAA